MGTDKALLTLGSETLLARSLRVLRDAGCEARIVGKAEKLAGFGSVVEDIYPECGPLGGIHSALRSSQAELNLMVAVDMPFIDSRFLRLLCARAAKNDALVTVPRADGRFQPLCAVYRRAFADFADRALQQGIYKVSAVFPDIKVEVMELTEIEAAGFSPDLFRNVNTPEEWNHARSQFPAES